jgi:hypothetical protein
MFIIEIWLSETHTTTDSNSRNVSHTSMRSNSDIVAQISYSSAEIILLQGNWWWMSCLIWKTVTTVCSNYWYSISLAILSFSEVCLIHTTFRESILLSSSVYHAMPLSFTFLYFSPVYPALIKTVECKGKYCNMRTCRRKWWQIPKRHAY